MAAIDLADLLEGITEEASLHSYTCFSFSLLAATTSFGMSFIRSLYAVVIVLLNSFRVAGVECALNIQKYMRREGAYLLQVWAALPNTRNGINWLH